MKLTFGFGTGVQVVEVPEKNLITLFHESIKFFLGINNNTVWNSSVICLQTLLNVNLIVNDNELSIGNHANCIRLPKIIQFFICKRICFHYTVVNCVVKNSPC